MKLVMIFITSVVALSTAFAGNGDPVQDQNVFDVIRQHYNGAWRGNMQGSVAAETLKNNSLLVELSDRFAEFGFFHIPLTQENILYIPPSSTSGRMNYFDRQGKSLYCGQSSYDLKNSPFPGFKCRFTVDTEGNVRSFVDRSTATSNAKPGGYDGSWETGTVDFHYRQVSEISGGANAYSDSGGAFSPRPIVTGKESFHLQIFDKVALELYLKLQATPENGSFGPRQPYQIKYGKQIWCLKMDKNDSAKCRIIFDFAGEAQAPARN